MNCIKLHQCPRSHSSSQPASSLQQLPVYYLWQPWWIEDTHSDIVVTCCGDLLWWLAVARSWISWITVSAVQLRPSHLCLPLGLDSLQQFRCLPRQNSEEPLKSDVPMQSDGICGKCGKCGRNWQTIINLMIAITCYNYDYNPATIA